MKNTESEAGQSPLGESLHTLFMEVFRLRDNLAGVMDDVHDAAGMATSELRVAYTVMISGEATVPDIAETLGVSRQYVQRLCDHLAWEGLLCYVDNPRHKRSKLLQVTPYGQNKLEVVRQNEAAIISRYFSGMDSGPVRAALGTLREINGRLRSRENPPSPDEMDHGSDGRPG